jgi:2-polyprenyl-6-methoxyphenol hydroxylase-like FAD-dependent oxidoreductase
MSEEMYDVVVVGYGPGAQTLAAVMGRRGHRVVAFERYPMLYNLPRAGHVDHEAVRMVQNVGDVETYVETMWPAGGDYVWINGKGDLLMLQPALAPAASLSGWHSDYTHWQPNLEDALTAAAADAGVEVHLGWEAVAVIERDDHVELVACRVEFGEDGRLTRTDEYRRARGRFLVGADGASSFVRTTLGITRDDLGFNERWLDVDMRQLRPHAFHPNIGQICDPARPRMLMPLGRDHRRFEWMLLPGETIEEMSRPEVAWKLLEEFGVTPENHEIARDLVYTFQARLAERWREGRVFLTGDAAHTMPPFAGQGLLSSMRDSNNLAWKLDLVLRGVADETVLDSYEVERRPHVVAWTELSLFEGRVSCELDPEVAAQRDARMLAGGPPPHFEEPVLGDGLFQRDEHGRPRRPAGTLSLQARVRHDGRDGLFDDVVGGLRFSLVTRGGLAGDHLRPDQLELLARLDTSMVCVGPTAEGPGTSVDLDGRYAEYFDTHGLAAVLARPDFYVFGGVGDLNDLPRLVDELAAQLRHGGAVPVGNAK